MPADDPWRGGGALHVAVIGTGLMGSQIAAEYAAAGHYVTVTHSSRTPAAEALTRIEGLGPIPHGQVRMATTTPEAAAEADLIVEALPESLEIKQHELREAQTTTPSAILCTSTSSLRVSDIATALDDPTRLVGTHYLNPLFAFDVVELVHSAKSDAAVVGHVERILIELGRRPIRVADVSGFVINRLQFSLLREAISLVDSGVISAEDLDVLMREGLGARWSAAGPFEVVSLGGPALFTTLAQRIFPTLNNQVFPPDSLDRHRIASNRIEELRQTIMDRLFKWAGARSEPNRVSKSV